MKTSNLRSKQRQINRALQSIAIPFQNQKAVTEGQDLLEYHKHPLLENENKVVNHSKRYYRPKLVVNFNKNTQQNKSRESKRYKSLQMGKNYKRISEQKLPYNLVQKQQQSSKPQKQKRSMQSMRLIESINNRYLRERNSEGKGLAHLKQKAKELINVGKYQSGLQILNKADELDKTDVNYLQLKGYCLLKLQKYEKALQFLNRAIIFDRKNSSQTYIWCALCEMQLHKYEKSNQYLDQCIRLFPQHYQAYYLKGKMQLKLKNYVSALQLLYQAQTLNAQKKEIGFYIAECLELTGDIVGSIVKYQQLLTEIKDKNLAFALKYAKILIKVNRFQDAQKIMQKCMSLNHDCKNSNEIKLEELMLESTYYLVIHHFKKGQYEKCSMKGQQILKRGNTKWTAETIKILMSAKIAMRDFYGAANLAQRLELIGCKTNLKELGIFCQGVILLMRKKAKEAVQKLQTCQRLLKKADKNYLNEPIVKIIHLYLFYAYFLTFNETQALKQLQEQKTKGLEIIYQNMTHYNEAITEGYIAYYNGQYDKAQHYFVKGLEGKSYKPDILLYLSITLFRKLGDPESQKTLEMYLDRCCKELQYFNNNIAAYSFYHQGLYKAFKGNYIGAAQDLDIAIQKSQDNFLKFFYLRGLIWALLQNYKQAISDISIGLTIDPTDIRCYQLRIRCMQIDGDPSQAFGDLQTFISLKPNDKEIHKLAGHLLFENGAFQDALQAFNQGEIQPHDSEVYLTRSKTNFLLGNFIEASADMLKVSEALNNSQETFFDFQIMKWLADLFLPYNVHENQQNYSFQDTHLKNCLQKLKNLYDEEQQGNKIFGKIFKQPQLYFLSALCKFYMKQYRSAVDSFMEVINIKVSNFQKPHEGDYEEEQAQKQIFINQMYYNIAICFCMMKDYKNAEKFLIDCKIDPDLHTYEVYLQFIQQIRGNTQIDPNEQYLQLFSFKNKISRFLPKVQVAFKHNNSSKIGVRKMKICIPYPKVEPPNISPVFNKSLIEQVSLDYIQRRPEAPWIFKQNNAIKFTDRMEIYSRFSLGESSVDEPKKEQIGVDFQQSMDFQIELMERLKLDAKVEQKLNKLLKNK